MKAKAAMAAMVEEWFRDKISAIEKRLNSVPAKFAKTDEGTGDPRLRRVLHRAMPYCLQRIAEDLRKLKAPPG